MPLLGGATSCPTWLLANDGELGYYRAAYGADVLQQLLAQGASGSICPSPSACSTMCSALVAAGTRAAR